MHRVHQDEKARQELMLDLDEIARQGAKKMLAQALLEALKYKTTSKLPEASASREAMPWC